MFVPVPMTPDRMMYEALRGDSRIDAIIPVHNSRATLPRALASIAMQTVVDDVDVTIVDDASDERYDDILAAFSPLLHVRLLRIDPPNRFPGYARQLALDQTRNDFVTFIDSDDTLSDSFALARLFSILLTCETCHVACGAFAGVQSEWFNTRFIAHREDRVHVFANLYRRSFLNENGIRFNTEGDAGRFNEDYGFNAPIFLCFDENTYFLPEIVYDWHENPNSLTHAGANLFHAHKFIGRTANMVTAFEKCCALRAEGKTAVAAAHLAEGLPVSFSRIYDMFVQSRPLDADCADALLALARRLWKNVLLPLRLEADIPTDEALRAALTDFAAERPYLQQLSPEDFLALLTL